jgi:SAM-dependent methyltransferase
MTEYDRVPYLSLPYRETHPEHLRLIAHLFRVPAAPPERCRVLEIGCAAGGNLIPMAETYPESRFLGVDLAPTAIAAGQAAVRTLGLGNIELRAADLADAPRDLGEYDYIIAQGVYSWVPDPVKAALLELIGRHLAQAGVAYLSHNVKPGHYLRRLAREMMLYHAGDVADPAERAAQARALLELVTMKSQHGRYQPALKEQLEATLRQPDWLLFHDYLAPVNDGCWLHELVAELEGRGLQFLGDADLPSMVPNLDEETRATLARIAPGVVRREQYLDFLVGREYRMTLVVRAGVAIDRVLDRTQARGLHFSARLTEGADGKFRTARGGELQVGRPFTRAALRELGRRAPASCAFEELCARVGVAGADVDELAGDLMHCFLARVVELALSPARCAAAAGERPRVAPHARLAARNGPHVTNLLHEDVKLRPELAGLAAMLDGTRDRAALLAAMTPPEPALLDALLAKLAGHALLLC